MSNYVLDASAILAAIFNEPGSNIVRLLEGRLLVSAVNVAEVATKLGDLDLSEGQAREEIDYFSFEIVPFAHEDALQAAFLRKLTKHAGLSLGDRACLATALSFRAKVLTTDRSWKALNVGVSIELVR